MVFWALASAASAAPPDWLQAAARDPLPKYPDDTAAVMLRNEQITTVKGSGEITTLHRAAFKILRPEGRAYGVVKVYYDSDTRVGSLKAWAIPAKGNTYEAGEKDSVDTILFSDNFYEDSRQKVLKIPGTEPGAVVGYEYEQRRRPSILQDHWLFQYEIPVRQARFTLNLPSGWEFGEAWANYAKAPVQSSSGSQSSWVLTDIPAIRDEIAMPAWEAVAGQMLVTYIRPGGGPSVKSWAEVGQWYSQLAAGRRQSAPAIRQKVMELTANSPSPFAKIQALSGFAQRDIRYVAIEIGIGGYQPHAAPDIFKNRYGDCKDKVTLLSAMLSDIGVDSYYVMINSRRGAVTPEFVSPLVFDHAILALRPPPGMPMEAVQSRIQHPQLGELVLFDPTDPYVKFGDLPGQLQASYGLVVSENSGELVRTPLMPPQFNGLERNTKLTLIEDGSLRGEVREIRRGASAADLRGAWLNATEADREKSIQRQLGRENITVELESLSAQDLDSPDKDPIVNYTFRLVRYATSAGGLFLLRPAVFQWALDLTQNGERTQPIEFESASRKSEVVEITLPKGWVVDELPPPLTLDSDPASYKSAIEVQGNTLRLTRSIDIKQIRVNADRTEQLKNFYRQVSANEKTRAVLKKQ
jgi:hypothetical protein